MTIMSAPSHMAPDAETLRRLIADGPSIQAARLLLPELDVTSLAVERVHFPGGKPVQLQLRACRAQGHSQIVIGEWVGEAADSMAVTEADRLAKLRRGQSPRAGARAVVADRAFGLILRRPGFDAKLPGLRLLHDREWASGQLAPLGLDPTSAIELVAHRLGKRAVLRITSPDGTLYARLRPVTSSSGQVAYDRHVALWAALQGVAGLTIPRPVAFAADLGLGLFDALPGTPPVFQGLDGFRATHAVMQAIAALQELSVEAPPHGAMDELTILRGWADRVAEVFPKLAQRLHAPLSRLQQDMAALAPMPSVPCHRDLHEGQILLDRGQASLLDFDTLRLGDPALDVGNLQAHLMLASLRDGLPCGAFVTAMETALPHLQVRRIALWRRGALLRLAMIYAFSATPPAVLDGLVRGAG
jgi:aminoglycoside phosphotransferase (APT) family kinase protein